MTTNLQKSYELKFKAMGGVFHYQAFLSSNAKDINLEKLFKKAHEEVLRIEKTYSEFQNSKVTQLNIEAKLKAVELDDEFYYLVKKSKVYFNLSDGAFDPTYSSYLKIWRERKAEKKQLGIIEKLYLKSLVNFNYVLINNDKRTIYLPKKDQYIGLGGIGKGYAVDRAFEFLQNAGIQNFSVNGCGDMRVHSVDSAPRRWKIGIRNPLSKNINQSAGLIQISNGSVSTSGSYTNYNNNTLRDHHIVSGYKSLFESPPISSTIIGETCMDTDVWGTITMALDIKKSLRLLDKHKKKAVLIDHRGNTFLSKQALSLFKHS